MSLQLQLRAIQRVFKRPSTLEEKYSAICQLEKFFRHAYWRPTVEPLLKEIANGNYDKKLRDKAKEILKDRMLTSIIED